MTTLKKYALLLFGAGMMFTTSCKKKDLPPTVPTVSTIAVTDVNTNTNTAKTGGNITGNGGAEVTSSGVCYSKTAQTPTISNNKVESNVTTGSFAVELTNIDPGSTYYIRAYATNSVGTGYGDVVTFTTGNGAPKANSLTVTGSAKVAEKLTAAYSYFDFENDPESGSTYQWYSANDAQGTGEVAIAGATTSTYNLLAADEFKYIRVGVVAKSSAGTSTGTEVKSSFVGPIAAPATTVTFTYNGQSVTYGIIVSSSTGRRWLDRNLGAPSVPTAYDNYANFGDNFQWGRGADGHQILTRNGLTNTETIKSATTTDLSNQDSPGHALYILNATTEPYDWRSPSNSNLWQGVNGINNPCPIGWRIPTFEELKSENITSIEDGFAKLKFTWGGSRSGVSGRMSSIGAYGTYWTSTVLPSDATFIRVMTYALGSNFEDSIYRASAVSCRCIKD